SSPTRASSVQEGVRTARYLSWHGQSIWKTELCWSEGKFTVDSTKNQKYNRSWESYCVLTPVGLTDLFAVVKEPVSHRPIAQLVDFIRLQSDKALAMSAKVWDELVRIEKSGLADAALMKEARKFRQEYLAHSAQDSLLRPSIEKSWLRWKLEH
ncbi:hypothetical protein, partial [Polaromonas sp.]|uniref:hypothetical protein n=1 Tax=Polaromonas sp. TaxID=1869339 RepID=UPI0035623D9A